LESLLIIKFALFYIGDSGIVEKAKAKVSRKNPLTRSQQFQEAVKAEVKKMIKGGGDQSDDEDNEPCTSKTAKKRSARKTKAAKELGKTLLSRVFHFVPIYCNLYLLLKCRY